MAKPRQRSSIPAATGVASTAAFFLCEGLLGQHFEVVPNGAAEPQPGDLFLFPLASVGPGWWGAHAGVYCGDGEIIHLEGETGPGPAPSWAPKLLLPDPRHPQGSRRF
uniref:NlpC/P60 domain-containing protein n=1 Tax=Nothoprocta perdicaria TaxID=30464 RepID=A0A8C6YHJ4_NOTPE